VTHLSYGPEQLLLYAMSVLGKGDPFHRIALHLIMYFLQM
jgi:hypothetical protein